MLKAHLTAGVSRHLPHLKLGAAAVVGDNAPVGAPATKSVRWCQVTRALLPVASEGHILNTPGSWNVGQATDWGLTEAPMKNSEVPPCTKSLNIPEEHSWSCDSEASFNRDGLESKVYMFNRTRIHLLLMEQQQMDGVSQ